MTTSLRNLTRQFIRKTSLNMANQAAWIKAPKANVEIGSTQNYTPGAEQVLVRVESIGFNPLEPKIQK